MAKYRKKPVEVEAFQYDGDLKDSNGNYYVPDWAVKAFEDGTMYYGTLKFNQPPCELFIDTFEGTCHVRVGDYIIKNIDEEINSCKSDVFEKTYEIVE